MSKFADLPTSSLLKMAMEHSTTDSTSDEREECLRVIRRRGELETFEVAKNWCASHESTARKLAADILYCLGELKQVGKVQLFPFTLQSIPLLDRLLDDPDEDVIISALHALGSHYVYEPIASRPSFAEHPSQSVRLAVVHAISHQPKTPPEIEMLMKLSRDQDGDVRDWATFDLGSMCSLDTPEIREALLARVEDNHLDARSEALLGLAIRKDARVIPFIKAELEAEMVSNLAVESAGEIAAADLVKSLEGLTEWWDVDTQLLNAALKRCRGESDPEEDWRWDNHPTV